MRASSLLHAARAVLAHVLDCVEAFPAADVADTSAPTSPSKRLRQEAAEGEEELDACEVGALYLYHASACARALFLADFVVMRRLRGVRMRGLRASVCALTRGRDGRGRGRRRGRAPSASARPSDSF
jgi:hypothetical protein